MEGGDEEPRKYSIRTTGVPAEIRTGHLTNGKWSLTCSDRFTHGEMVSNRTLGGLARLSGGGRWKENSKWLLIRSNR
jgi:hypothetical protein